MSSLGTNGLLLCDIRPASSRVVEEGLIQVRKAVQRIVLVLAYIIIGSLPSFGQGLRKHTEKGAVSLYYLGILWAIDIYATSKLLVLGTPYYKTYKYVRESP